MKGNFNNIINDKKPVLVDFHAEWCGPCKEQAPILKELAKGQEEVRIIKIDIDKNPEIAQKYGVRSVPTLMLFKEGRNLWKQSGVLGLAELKAVISQYLV
ncbi:thioredoxin [Flagellimonas abyssi]|uniref:Thioredoxin n=1 Tax=Flagellimonas abyssi TaxID=2864871 RepID=A0ABS7EWY7_9FLAO|nr:thioredoxin [Allomuricauda abyssi]MBW8201991.1 thioredoxin [Allomuricauda abyssi]